MADAMEALLVRIDHFHDRKLYVSTIKTWLEALDASHGRLVTMGDVHLLLIEATSAQNDALLERFKSTPVDTNAKGELCIDRFIDVVGRKQIDAAVCKGFLEMNVLNTTLLEKLMVGDWHCEKAWLADALSTPRTKALIQWREEAKNARKDRRKRAAQDRDAERAAKKAKAAEEAARRAEAAENGDEAEEEESAEHDKADGDEAKDDYIVKPESTERGAPHAPSPSPKKPQTPTVKPSKPPNARNNFTKQSRKPTGSKPHHKNKHKQHTT